MAQITVTPELLRAKANELRGIRQNHDDSMSQMRNLITSLTDVWTGASQDAFLAKYESLQPTFTQFSQMIDDFAMLMDTHANRMEETDQAMSQAISSSN